MRTALIILRKDLRLELRTMETVPAMVLLALVTFVIFHFGLNRDAIDGQLAAGVLTATLLFAACWGSTGCSWPSANRAGFDAFLLAPVDRTAMLVAKASALFVFLAVLEVIAVPAVRPVPARPVARARAAGLILVLVLANVGAGRDRHAGLGDRSAHPRARPDRAGHRAAAADPGADRTARAIGPLLTAHSSGSPPGRWLAILGLYDLVFALLAYAVFDFLLED